jgi:hypothetical protein
MNARSENPRSENRDKVELEREGDEIREDLDRTLDALGRKLAPDRLMERSVEYLRENGSQVVQEIGQTVRAHPLPILLTAAGLVWLTGSIVTGRSGNGSAGARRRTRRASSDGDGQYSRTGGNGTSRGGKTRRVLRQGAATVRDKAQDIGSGISDLVRNQPLAVGALAVATGAIIGAALPVTSYESELLGDLPEKAGQKMRDMIANTVRSDNAPSTGNAQGSETSPSGSV